MIIIDTGIVMIKECGGWEKDETKSVKYYWGSPLGILLSPGMRGRSRRAMVTDSRPKEIGRERKIPNPPPDMISDCRKAFSSIGLSTNASTSGAPSYPNFFIQYPTPPKMIMMMIST